MSDKRTYASVSDIVHEVSDDASFAKEMDSILESRQLITTLIAQRCARRISQTDLAIKLKCSQSRVSKLESGNDADLRLGDLIEYAAAIEMEPHLVLHKKGMSAVDKVQFHALSMKRALDGLATLAKDDESMSRAAFSFCGETVFNVLRFIGESSQELIARRKDDSLQFVVEVAEASSADPSVPETTGNRQRRYVSRTTAAGRK